MELTLALVVTLAGHLAVTVWWASRMDAHVKHLIESVNTLVNQGAVHNATLADHSTRITVLERQVG